MRHTAAIPDQADWYFSPLTFIAALFSYVLLVRVALTLGAIDVSKDTSHSLSVAQAVTQRSAQGTFVLLTVAVCAYFLRYRGGFFKRLWRDYWSFACLALFTHLWFALTGVFGGSIDQVFTGKDLVSHPAFDSLLAIWWGIDVALAWVGDPETEDIFVRYGRGLAHVIFPFAFFMATREEKATWPAHVLGDLLAIVIVAVAICWASVRPPLQQTD